MRGPDQLRLPSDPGPHQELRVAGDEFEDLDKLHIQHLRNGSYGSIRLSQERAYPGRVSATDLVSPDFAALARAYGGFGASVERTADFAAAFEAASASGRPAIVHLKVSVDCMTPAMDLAAVRALAAKTAQG